MIHFTTMGASKKIGLNLYRAPGGFVAWWVWYTPATYELHGWRLRIRLHMSPRILWSIERTNVIDGYRFHHDVDFVGISTLADLKAMEDQQKRTNEPLCYVKPVRETDGRA